MNSGKSTREHNIEDTALQTNLEAAEEVTRQLRLRDLAGLVVIDFIDMEESKNNRAVERKLKDCLKNDRARIQVGRISHFGLLEMSRQRIRTGVLESSTTPCPHCQGTGMIRSVESVALHVLRSIEDNLLKGASHNLIIRTTTQVALYILNQKRSNLFDLETRFGVEIEVHADDMVNGQLYVLERGAPVDRDRIPAPAPIVQPDTVEIIDETTEQPVVEEQAQDEDGDGRRRRRRRKRRRGGSDQQSDENEVRQTSGEGDEQTEDDDASQEARSEDGDGDDEPRRKRRRGRRGGRRGRRNGDDVRADGEEDESTEAQNIANGEAQDGFDAQEGSETEEASEDVAEVASSDDSDATPAEVAETDTVVEATEESVAEVTEDTPEADGAVAAEAVETLISEETIVVETPTSEQPVAADAPEEDAEVKPSAPAEPVVTSETSQEEKEDKPKRVGWWQRGRSFF